MNTQPKWSHAFRANALTVNPDLVPNIDCELENEAVHANETAFEQHWIFRSALYTRALADVVAAVRAVHNEAQVPQPITDREMAARMLQGADLWDAPQPNTVWEKTRFCGRFLCAYADTFMRAKAALKYERIATSQLELRSAQG